jgi:hypothetical protein
MKYLFTILGIAVAATLLTLYFVWPEKQAQQTDIAVTVNGHGLARSSIAAPNLSSDPSSDDFAALLDSAITRELLIQEAQRQDIDKEALFRDALKTFYEQSLIKILTDRQYSQVKVTVEEREIDVYLALYGKMVTFSRLPVAATPPYAPEATKGDQNEVLFDDLSESLQLLLAGLKPGEFAIKFDTGSDRYAIRLDKLAPAQTADSKPPARDVVRNMLMEHKRQQQIVKWLDELRTKASITIHNG